MKTLFSVNKETESKPIDAKKSAEPVSETPKKEPKKDVSTESAKPKKRGRPPKPKTDIVETVKKDDSKKQSKPNKETVKESPKKTESQPEKKKPSALKVEGYPKGYWTLYGETKPEEYVPCEFYVDDESGKITVSYGYISHDGGIITDDPYRVVVLRKKYNNLYYHPITECGHVARCPNMYPHCDRCPIMKKKKGS